MSNVTTITSRKKRVGYTLEVFPSAAEGFTCYEILNPDGSLYGGGMRKGTEKEVGDFYQKTVNRLNSAAGFKSGKWCSRAVNNGTPTAIHAWKRETVTRKQA